MIRFTSFKKKVKQLRLRKRGKKRNKRWRNSKNNWTSKSTQLL